MKKTTTLLSALIALVPALFAEVPKSAAPPTLPAPVASFGAAATPEGHVFIYGGHAGVRHKYHRDDVNGELHHWKAGDTQWTSLGAGEPAQGASLIAFENKVIRVGGMAARNAKEEKQDLWSSETATIYDLNTSKWIELPKLPQRRSSHDSTVIGSTLYVIGGWALTGGGTRSAEPEWHNTYLTLDLAKPDAKWQTHEQPFERRALAVQPIGHLIYAIGGMSSGDEPVPHVDILDTTSGKWTKGPALPADKLGGFGFAAVSHEGRLFASGVVGELLELCGDAWVPVVKLAHPRFFHRLLPGGKAKLIAIGGESRQGEKAPPEVIELPAKGETKMPVEEKKTVKLLESGPAPTWPTNVPSEESDWPGYQGPRGNSTTPEVGWNTKWPADGPPVAWKASLGTGLSSFAIVNGKVYASGNDGKDHESLVCLDLTTGKQLWQHQVKVVTKAHEMPIVPNGPASTPLVIKDRAWFITREGDVICLNAEDGSTLWSKSMINDLGGKRPVYGWSTSPFVHNGRLYLDVGGQGKSTACLNAITGDIIWQTGDGEAGYSTPQIVRRKNQDVLILFKGEALELRNAANGTLLARHETTTRDFCNCATPIVVGEKVFISHTGNMGARTLEWNGDEILTELWSDKEVGLLFHSGLPWQQNVLVFNDQLRGANDLRLIDLSSGETRWKNTDIARGSGILCDDGHAILLSNTGEAILAKVKADGLEILSQFQAIKPKAWCQPAISRRHLLVKNNEGEVICYKL